MTTYNDERVKALEVLETDTKRLLQQYEWDKEAKYWASTTELRDMVEAIGKKLDQYYAQKARAEREKAK